MLTKDVNDLLVALLQLSLVNRLAIEFQQVEELVEGWDWTTHLSSLTT